MVKLTVDEFVEKHARRLKGATEDIRRGVDKVDVAPGEKAAEKEEKFKAKLLDSIERGVWRKRVSAVTLSDWKERMRELGIPRISKGIDMAADKMREFGAALLPHVEKGQAEVEKMPDLTLDDSAARMDAFMRHMAKLKFKER